MVFTPEDPHTCPCDKGGRHTGDPLLLGHYAKAVTTFEKHFHQVGTGAATCRQQQLKPLLPKRFKKTH